MIDELDGTGTTTTLTVALHRLCSTIQRKSLSGALTGRCPPLGLTEGEGSCALLCNDLDAAFLITDGLRALPELQTAVDAQVAISPLVLKALVTRQVLDRQTPLEKLDHLAEQRSWLGQPIYRRAQKLFGE